MERLRSSLRLAEFATALSLATDLGQGKPMEMVLATCLLSMRLGDLLGLSDDELRDVYYLALFRHAGCTAASHVAAETFGDEREISSGFYRSVDPTKLWTMFGFVWRNVYLDRPHIERIMRLPQVISAFMQAVMAHCEVASQFAARLDLDQRLQANLLQTNEAWNGSGVPGTLKGEAISRSVRVIQVAGEAVALTHFVGIDAAIAAVRQRGGITLDPQIVECFCASAEHLIERANPTSSMREAVLSSEPGPKQLMTHAQVEAAGQALADFVDLKSPHMTGHSTAVARLAGRSARPYGLIEADETLLRRAGYIHDLGRVSVSSRIWCKPGALSDSEWESVRLYPYYTQRILAQPQALAEWGTLAATHRERLDSSGYHRNLPATMLAPAMRLLAVADTYQSMTERRPYRAAHSAEQAAQLLKQEARSGRLDGEAVNAVLVVAGQLIPNLIRRDRVAGLTEREIEVLRCVARGYTNREIAQQLVVSQKTVGNHLQHIFGKIDVTTRAAATYFAMQHHLI